VSSNGYLTFGSDGTSFRNTELPDPGEPNALIAAFWDDLVTGAGVIRTRAIGAAPSRRLVVEWSNVGFFFGSGNASFEAILEEGTNRIVFQYRDVRTPDSHDAGGSATVGIEDPRGEFGLAHSFNQPALADATALAFSPIACAEGDGDGDAVCDADDNCLVRANPDQSDANLCYGDACDADYDDDGVVGGSDYIAFGVAFGAREGDPAYRDALDANGDGWVGGAEYLLLGRSFGAPPGPSGLACAGTIPCPAQ
jgi:hypothetical protein